MQCQLLEELTVGGEGRKGRGRVKKRGGGKEKGSINKEGKGGVRDGVEG